MSTNKIKVVVIDAHFYLSMITLCLFFTIVGAVIGFIISKPKPIPSMEAARIAFADLTPLQHVVFINDMMKGKEVRSTWQSLYCSQRMERLLSQPIKVSP